MSAERPIYFSLFMFDTNARLNDPAARRQMVTHMRALASIGYAGFELHIGRTAETALAFPTLDEEVRAYAAFRRELDDAGLAQIDLTTNVGVDPETDPGSADAAIRSEALRFLASRVAINAALRSRIMMGPVVVPYGAFLDPIWSDALQDELALRYQRAAPVLQALGLCAEQSGVKVAIEPITHWETPGPNKLAATLEFLQHVPSKAIGVVIDSAHETLDGDGPEVFARQVLTLVAEQRLHYVQASPPDRGDLCQSWLPWQALFGPLLPHYDGPVAIEIFNALPAFAAGLRLSRRKYWIPGQDPPGAPQLNAYTVARASLEKLRREFADLGF